jgi:hypothetical protein
MPKYEIKVTPEAVVRAESVQLLIDKNQSPFESVLTADGKAVLRTRDIPVDEKDALTSLLSCMAGVTQVEVSTFGRKGGGHKSWGTT